MSKFVKAVRNFVAKEDGVAMAEYALLLALIAVAITTAVVAFRTKIIAAFTTATGNL